MRLGIDFGTTRIVVALVDRGNFPLQRLFAGLRIGRAWRCRRKGRGDPISEKFIAIGGPRATPDATAPLMVPEIESVWRDYAKGLIREIDERVDQRVARVSKAIPGLSRDRHFREKSRVSLRSPGLRLLPTLPVEED